MSSRTFHAALFHRQRGSAMAQWCIAALPLLILGSICIELSQWHATRQQFALLAQRAVDAAALDGGTTAALRKHWLKHHQARAMAPATVCVTDRVADLMADFADLALSRRLGKKVIRHDHIEQQHQDALKRGWPGGQGPKSRVTIFAANVLSIEVTIRYRPVNPWVRQIVNPVIMRIKHRAIMQSHRPNNPQPCFEYDRRS